MKTAKIYRDSNNYFIITYSTTNTGIDIADKPIYLIPLKTGIDTISTYIFLSLNNSKKGVKTPKLDEWPKWQQNILNEIKYNNISEFYRNTVSCALEMKDSRLCIFPLVLNNRSHKGNKYNELESVLISNVVQNKNHAVNTILQILNGLYNKKFI